MDTRNQNNLHCGFVNIQSVGNKTIEIRELIVEKSFDVLAIAETWLGVNDKAKIHDMTPSTHTFLHVPRANRRGGGVGIFINNEFQQIKLLAPQTFNTFESLAASFLVNGNLRHIFIVVYRPPQTSSVVFIEEFITYLEHFHDTDNIYICGDFNLRIDDVNDQHSKTFIDMMSAQQLLNKVHEPTSQSGHILDLVFCDSILARIHHLEVEPDFATSPCHKLITFMIEVRRNSKSRKSITYRNKTTLDSSILVDTVIEKICSEISSNCLHTLDTVRKVEDCLDCLVPLYTNTLRSEYENMCPVITKVIIEKDNTPWFNAQIMNAIKIRRHKEKIWRRVRTDQSRREYVSTKSLVNKLIRKRKCMYYKQKITEAGTDAKRLYSVLNNLTGKSCVKKLPDGHSDMDLANDFMKSFDGKIRNIVSSLEGAEQAHHVTYMPDIPYVGLTSFSEISIDALKTLLKNIKKTYCLRDPFPMSDVANGEDFLKLSSVLLKIVNLSVRDCVFPESEKLAIVKPTLKSKLDRQCLSSYRPVSNLSFLSKVIECVIHEQLMDYLSTINALPDNQSAYRKLHSTETALCSVTNDILCMMDEGKCGVLILLDLSAAFDTVVHDLLLEDLQIIGVRDRALQYLRNYLVNRSYCVQVGNSFSEQCQLNRGVPQGSVLGPVLFSIYTMELSFILKDFNVTFALYADDTQFYLTVNNILDTEITLTRIMGLIKRWMNKKQLKLNEGKTECLLVGKKCGLRRFNEVQCLHVNGTNIYLSDKVKNLGVLVDKYLSLNDQINEAVRVARYNLRNIAFIRKYLDEHSIKSLVQNHVIAKLDYCNSLYYNLPNYQLRKLQLTMNRAARMIKHVLPRDRITPVLIELHWLPVKARIIYKICVLTYQVMNTGMPAYLRKLLHPFEVGTGVVVRHAADEYRLNEPRCLSDVGFRAFRVCAPRLYNRLPVQVKASNNINLFKKRLKTFLFREAYDMSDMTVTEQYSV